MLRKCCDMKFLHICENEIITLFLFESNFQSVKTLNPFIKFRKYYVFDAVLHRVNPFSTVKCTNFSNNIFCSTVIRIKYCLHSRTIASGNYWWEQLLLQNKSKKVLSVQPGALQSLALSSWHRSKQDWILDFVKKKKL